MYEENSQKLKEEKNFYVSKKSTHSMSFENKI